MKRVGNYVLQAEIGRGAFGSVWKGFIDSSKEIIAIKVVPLKGLSSRLTMQLEREISVMKMVNSPYIVKFIDTLRTQQHLYVVMEYCSGGDLESFLKVKKVPELLGKRWLGNLIDAFTTLQQNNVLHRDLKLANILLSDANPDIAVAKVADFGFARFISGVQMAETVLGTPLFMAPEILSRHQYNYKVDVWSLGVMAYEMLVGQVAFLVFTMEQLVEAQRRPVTFPANCDLSAECKELIVIMLTYNPVNRPSFEEVRNHPFFTQVDSLLETYDVVSEEEEKSHLEPHFQCQTVDSSASDNNVRNWMLTIEHQSTNQLVLAQGLVQKFQESQKFLLACGVLMIIRDQLHMCKEQLAEICQNFPQENMTKIRKLSTSLQQAIQEVERALEELQGTLREEDLMSSKLIYRDTGIGVEGRLLIQEADSMMASMSCMGVDSQIAVLKDVKVLLSIACFDAKVEHTANEKVNEVTQRITELEGTRFRT